MMAARQHGELPMKQQLMRAIIRDETARLPGGSLEFIAHIYVSKANEIIEQGDQVTAKRQH